MSRTLKAIWRTAALGVCVAAAISSRLAGQAGAWYPPLPTGPFSGGAGSIFSSAPDNPVAGFTGPEGAGVSPYLGLDTDQFVNPSFSGWATQVAAYAPANPGLIDSTWSDPTKALGPVTGDAFDIVSLGELSASDINNGVAPGSITLAFNGCIADGPGPDFAVFENTLQLADSNEVFAELAYVEVSSNGADFVRFPSVYLNPPPQPAQQAYEYQDPTGIYNLAGKHLNGYGQSWGTPFELKQLANNPLVLSGNVDLNNIRYVRIVDIPGSGAYKDTLGHAIYDPWPTTGSPGFDLEAVGVLNAAALVPMVDWVTPNITSQPANATVTEGNPAFFTVAATGAPQPTYHWQRLPAGSATWAYLRESDGYSGTNNPTLTVENTDTGMTGDAFRCVGISSAGKDTSNAATLTVMAAPPELQSSPGNLTVSAGQQANFPVSVAGATAWQWQVSTDGGKTWGNLTDGGGIAGSASATLKVGGTTEAMSGWLYRCVASNGSGKVTSGGAKLTVISAIVFKLQPKSQAVKAGATVTFSAVATGNGALHYQWRLNGTGIAGATNATLTLKGVKTTAAGNYTVVVTTLTDSNTSNAAVLQVAKVVPKITAQPAPATTTVKAGSKVTYKVTVTGDAPLSYVWQKGTSWANLANGGKVSGANTPTLVLTGVASGTAGSYRVVVSNPAGTATSKAVKLVVK